ncbi:MAG: lipid A deacylase LpxR family protein, partial [Psychromonas sp.]
MTRLIKKNIVLLSILTTIFSPICLAEELNKSADKEKDTWYALTAENDAVTLGDNSDDGYTNGVAWSWGYDPKDSFAEVDMPNWIRKISEWTYLNDSNNHSFSINYVVAQGMFTPDDLTQEEVIEDDRPYAGTLTWSTRIYSFDNQIANSLGLTLGVVGPASLAEQAQTGIHKLIDATEPQGWDNQLSNEPVFRIDAAHVRRLFDYDLSNSLQFDTNSYSEAGVGNLRSDIGTGLSIRIGNRLSESFAYINPAPARGINNTLGSHLQSFNWHLAIAAYGSYVFNDIT